MAILFARFCFTNLLKETYKTGNIFAIYIIIFMQNINYIKLLLSNFSKNKCWKVIVVITLNKKENSAGSFVLWQYDIPFSSIPKNYSDILLPLMTVLKALSCCRAYFEKTCSITILKLKSFTKKFKLR